MTPLTLPSPREGEDKIAESTMRFPLPLRERMKVGEHHYAVGL